MNTLGLMFNREPIVVEMKPTARVAIFSYYIPLSNREQGCRGPDLSFFLKTRQIVQLINYFSHLI